MKHSIFLLPFLLLLSSAYAETACPKPKEYAATAFKIIAKTDSTELNDYLEKNTVSRTVVNEDCEDMYLAALKSRNENARRVLENIGYGPRSAEDINKVRNKNSRVTYYNQALTYSSLSVIKELKHRGGKLGESEHEVDYAVYQNSFDVIDWLAGKNQLTDEQFCVAVGVNKIGVIDKLIRRGSDVSGENILRCAANRGDLAIVKLLVLAGSDVLKPSKNYSILDAAAASGDVKTFEYLRSEGAKSGDQIMRSALSSRSVTMLKHLLSVGYGLEYRTKEGLNLLHLLFIREESFADYSSARFDDTSKVLLNFLVDQGIDINSTDSEGFNLFRYVKSEAAAKWLLGRGANIEHRNNKNETPLLRESVTFQFDSSPRLKLLTQLGANANATDKNGNTGLHLIFLQDSNVIYKENIKDLLQGGAFINSTNLTGYTALHLATKFKDDGYVISPNWRRDAAIKSLLENGANQRIRVIENGVYKTAYDLYIESTPEKARDKKILELLKN